MPSESRSDRPGGHALPDGLDERGEAFWRAVVDEWELRPDELQLLVEVARALDTVEMLQRQLDADGMTVAKGDGTALHPALCELRLQRQTLARALAQLSLPNDDGTVLASPLSARGRRAAESRWAMTKGR